MKKEVNELLETFCSDEFEQSDFTGAPPSCARHQRERTMDKTNKSFLPFSAEDARPDRTFANTSFEPGLYLKDKRVAQLLLLLRQLDQSVGGLGTLPQAELCEIVCSAVGVCGFVNPIEAQDVIAAVLDAFETQERVLQSLPIFVPPE
jgi:hypothetical protein